MEIILIKVVKSTPRGGRGGDRGGHAEVTIPADLDEDIEFFEISKSDADYSFITDLKSLYM